MGIRITGLHWNNSNLRDSHRGISATTMPNGQMYVGVLPLLLAVFAALTSPIRADKTPGDKGILSVCSPCTRAMLIAMGSAPQPAYCFTYGSRICVVGESGDAFLSNLRIRHCRSIRIRRTAQALLDDAHADSKNQKARSALSLLPLSTCSQQPWGASGGSELGHAKRLHKYHSVICWRRRPLG